MLSQFLKLERFPHEGNSSYHRRRMRVVASIARQGGLWGEDHARRVIDWALHLKRDRNRSSLASQLYIWRNEEWLAQRRRDPLVGGAARPGTRRSSGPLHRRWDEAVESAREALTEL